MKAFVGTSGWFYDWNKDRNLDWFLANSGLNTVELNASFYRFPFKNHVNAWARKGNVLRWAIKVHRFITHVHKFNEQALETLESMHDLFKPLDKNIDFFLFQVPPYMKPEMADKIADFYKSSRLKQRFAIEFRNKEWFTDEWYEWAKKLGLTLVSVDAPLLPRFIFNSNGFVYLRMHGRLLWYSHNYSDTQLKEIRRKIMLAKPRSIYVYFNNNHNMLRNAQAMMRILKK